MCNTNSVSNLYFTFISKTCCYNVFSYITCCICCRTVNLSTVFTGKGSAAVARRAAVGIGNDLAAGKSAVACGAADDKASRRIDEILRALIKQLFSF